MSMSDADTRAAVQERYASAARTFDLTATEAAGAPTGGGCCGGGCCGGDSHAPDEAVSTVPRLDPITGGLYDEAETPFDAALAASLGCGNPTALAELRPGEDVLDLGCGGGLDVLLSARRVASETGRSGTAHGLDLTPEMLALAEKHRDEAGVENARFLLGQIEAVPLSDASVDVVISNCVINLSTDKDAVLREAFRVLRPGGRFAVSDIVLLREIPAGLRGVMSLWTGCISGALLDASYVDKLTGAGFVDAGVEVTRRYDRQDLEDLADQMDLAHLPAGMTRDQAVETLDGAFASAFVRATKPAS